MTPRNFYTKFLTVKSTKSLINLVDYITDKHDEHINHLSDNHKTIVFDEQQVIDRKLKNMINIFNYHNTKVKLNRKGGRPGSPASSIMISIPENIANKTVDIKTMEKFHKKMVDDTVSKLNEIYNLNWTKEEEELFKNNYLISSIHFKKSNPHINIMIPSIVQTYKNIEKDNKVMRAKSAILKIRLG
ncbi:MAG: hypothetical protein KKB94_11880, partial [Proteobacteria bacterium]|nr:hypothetical protein [Pseudomonadota bacterium]